MRPRPVLPSAIALEPGAVTITWRDGRVDRHRPRDLRLRCPCAHCVHELTGAALLDPASVAATVHATAQRAVGNYALQFQWSDGHSTGLYTYALLRGLGDAASAG